MNKEEIEKECEELIKRYYEEVKKYEELLRQFVPISCVELGKPLERPKRVLNTSARKELKEAEQKLDKLRKEMDEGCNSLYEAYH